jgi:DNA-binding XRE family transcriptional regulator
MEMGMRRSTQPWMLPLVIERLSRNMSQADVADAIGVSAATISNCETGSKDVSGNTLKAYAALFGKCVKTTFEDYPDYGYPEAEES